jgi:chromosome segregation ATPase
LGAKNYKSQAVWFLNAFWEDFGPAEAERIWGYTHRISEIDTQKKGEGCAVDEFQAHQFLEQCRETLTVLQMREHIRSVGIDKVKLVPFIHYLIFRYKVDWHYLVNAPQGNPEEITRAQRLLEAVQAALAEATERATEAKAAERQAQAREAEAKRDEAEAKRTEAEAKKREEEAKRTEAEAKRTEADAKAREAEAQARADELRAAKDELAAALAELKAQEDAYHGKTEELKRKSEEGSVVQRNKAKNELAQHLGEDPLPLRRAKITQEAAVKKAERAAKIAEEAAAQAAQAREAAEAARREAEQARREAESARRQAEQAREAAEAARQAAEEARHEAERTREAADAAVHEAEQKVAEAEQFLEETKAKAGTGKGALWWIDRELHEAKAYMPTSKGGYKKTVGYIQWLLVSRCHPM